MSENTLTRCPGCFLEPWSGGPCPRCAYVVDAGAFPTALRPGTRLAKYLVGRVLGRPGGFGITYLAFDAVLNRRVAIKELMPRDLVARKPDGETLHVHTREDEALFAYTLTSFLNEARLIAQFSHPHVVRVLDFFEANGTAYFAMEYYQGATLAEHVRRAGGRIPGDQALGLMLPILDALEHIHTFDEPILHRDIKPANIYLTDRGTPILLDFGAARVAMGQQSRSLSAVLTPGFAPYEQYSSRGNQGPWTDVYGCAATLYFLVTGQAPPDASVRLDDPHVEPASALAPDLSPVISEAIMSGLGFRRDDRPPSARAFADRLTGRSAPPDAAATGRAGGGDTLPASRTLVAAAGGGSASMRTAVAPDGRTAVGPARGSDAWTDAAPPRRANRGTPGPGPTDPHAGADVWRSRTWMAAAAAAGVVLVVAVTLALSGGGTPETTSTATSDRASALPSDGAPSDPAPRTGTIETPGDDVPVTRGTDTTQGESSAGPPARRDIPEQAPAPAPSDTDRPDASRRPAADTPPPNPAPESVPGEAVAGGPAPGAAAQPAPAPVPPAAATGVLVVVYGDDANAARQVETLILRQLGGREGLQAMDAAGMAIMRQDQSAVTAAAGGDFGALAALGRQHGAELLVVGDLTSRAAPSVNRFYSGTAEIDLKMYRVSTGTLVDARTFRGDAQLDTSEGGARSRAAADVGNAAASAVRQWATRAFN